MIAISRVTIIIVSLKRLIESEGSRSKAEGTCSVWNEWTSHGLTQQLVGLPGRPFLSLSSPVASPLAILQNEGPYFWSLF